MADIKTVQPGKTDLLIMKLRATAITPLYTGENNMGRQRELKVGNRLPTRRTGDRVPKAVVSIFGVMRGVLEQIYRAEGACDTGKNAKGCGACQVCLLFGFLGRKGRATFEDLVTVQPFEKCVQPVVHPHIEREAGTLAQGKGASIELEEITEGTELIGRILIKSATETDLTMIMAGLAATEDQGIGGWTRRGKGKVRFEVELVRMKWEDYKQVGRVLAKELVERK